MSNLKIHFCECIKYILTEDREDLGHTRFTDEQVESFITEHNDTINKIVHEWNGGENPMWSWMKEELYQRIPVLWELTAEVE